MKTLLLSALLVVTWVPATWAARQRVLLFPPTMSDAEVGALVTAAGGDRAYFDTAPSCKEGVLPCRRRARDGTTLWQATADGAGGCLGPIVRITDLAGKRWEVGVHYSQTCSMRLRVFGPRLAMADLWAPDTYFTPLVSGLSFPDPDNDSPGIWFQPLLSQGYEIFRRRTVRQRLLKAGEPYLTHCSATLDCEEEKRTSAPAIITACDEIVRVNRRHPWMLDGVQPISDSPSVAPPLTTHNLTMVCHFKNQSNQTNNNIVQCAVGPNAFSQCTCQFSGFQPATATPTCQHISKVLLGPRTVR